ncbi:hypothetical protein EIN_183010 [Entamoeba invadens IP1]|uniref:hypothetical protein n=1 Tax=Entamoeba invadens IP1 TaxID=370355 RepID=UPI0002C3D005|nr:hypothetical protein EIN_183010 [Entamoeba invadens IP1]ELP94044.1 hypothetical protein EIN_183010 [Entamoeba invadens IP1]|eukprot:XP_004260815.1 hypothetical protein EIN_183010 [Entamoeba invadens IP1]
MRSIFVSSNNFLFELVEFSFKKNQYFCAINNVLIRPKKWIEDSYNELCVQCVLISILNKFHTFVVQRPVKKGNVSLQLINIRRIETGSDWIDVEAFVVKRVQERQMYDVKIGISQDTAKQRITKNKTYEQIHLLIDLAWLNGFFCNSTFTSGSRSSMVCENVVEIYLKNKIILSTDKIYGLGIKVNQMICRRLETQYSIVIEKNDNDIQSVLEQFELK